MLAFVFGPGVDDESFNVDTWGLSIEENVPTGGAVAAANSFVFVHVAEEFGGLSGSDHVLDGDEDRPIVRIDLLEHRRANPVIPFAEIDGGVGQGKQRPEQYTRGSAQSGDGKSVMHVGVQGHKSPKRTACCNAALEGKKIKGKDSGADPIRSELLDDDIEKRHEDGPGSAAKNHDEAENWQVVKESEAEKRAGKSQSGNR